MRSNDLMPGSRKENRFEARRSLIAHYGRLPHPFSLAAATVNIVNLVNLPTPYCICNVKNGAKSTEKGIEEDLHNKLPTPLYSSQCSQCSQTGFLAIFHQLLECIFYNIRSKIAVLSLFCEPNEYVCTYMKPKAIFCYGMCEHCELSIFMKFTQMKSGYSSRRDPRSAQKRRAGAI